MIKLLEPELLVRCREEDVKLIKELIPECERQYVEIMTREAHSERTYKTKLTLVEGEFLTAAQGGSCGGVILTSLDKRIVCNNTLQFRLELCFEELLPQIRGLLFPEKVPETAEEEVAEGGVERKSHAAAEPAKHHK